MRWDWQPYRVKTTGTVHTPFFLSNTGRPRKVEPPRLIERTQTPSTGLVRPNPHDIESTEVNTPRHENVRVHILKNVQASGAVTKRSDRPYPVLYTTFPFRREEISSSSECVSKHLCFRTSSLSRGTSPTSLDGRGSETEGRDEEVATTRSGAEELGRTEGLGLDGGRVSSLGNDARCVAREAGDND
nr:hypothetical protein Itr_chr03CG06980 [Ipomoea trifida]